MHGDCWLRRSGFVVFFVDLVGFVDWWLHRLCRRFASPSRSRVDGIVATSDCGTHFLATKSSVRRERGQRGWEDIWERWNLGVWHDSTFIGWLWCTGKCPWCYSWFQLWVCLPGHLFACEQTCRRVVLHFWGFVGDLGYGTTNLSLNYQPVFVAVTTVVHNFGERKSGTTEDLNHFHLHATCFRVQYLKM